MAGINVGPSRGFRPNMMQRPAGPAQRPMGMGGGFNPLQGQIGRFNPPPENQVSPPLPVPIDQGGVALTLPPMQPDYRTTQAPMPGPIDTGPSYTNPSQTSVPDMAMQQNIGQNIRRTGGLRGAYGGAAAGLAGGPFRRQMFY